MRALHVIHDFLPRHQAGSEIYAATLCQALRTQGTDVDVLCADYDLSLPHNSLRWRRYQGLRVIELINNWAFSSFEEIYQSAALTTRLRQVLQTVRPDVLHIHNLLNLSFDLPVVARELGIPSVATLHDYTLVCPSGGQRVHQAERHICTFIEPERCARCFAQHNFHARLVFGGLALRRGATPRRLAAAADLLRRRAPRLFGALVRGMQTMPSPAAHLDAGAIERRLEAVTRVFLSVDRFIAPSASLAGEYLQLGMPADRLVVSDYGFVPLERLARRADASGRVKIGFVGTLVWHKGVHILLEAARRLRPGTFELLIYGDTATFPDYVAGLQHLGRGLPVRFMGRFERNHVAKVYSTLDLLVVPSLWPENSPLVIHEAFQSGIPVVGSRQGGTQDLITHGRDGLLYDAFSAEALAAALQPLIDDPARLRRLAAAVPAVKTVQEDARQIAQLYGEVAVRPALSSWPAPTPPGGTFAVLLNYRTPEDTILAAHSVEAAGIPACRTIVVDNASGDGSAARIGAALPDVRVIAAESNAGFSAGCNLGIREALRQGAARILLLNSDVVVPRDTPAALGAVLDADPSIGIVGPALVSRMDPGRVASAGIRYTPATGRMRHHAAGGSTTALSGSGLRIVDAVSGCAMLIRREVLERVGAFAEEFFFGFEDLDLCLRARDAGYRSACLADALVLHEGSLTIGASSARLIYFTTRNHLLLDRRRHRDAQGILAIPRQLSIVGLNLAYVLISSRVSRGQGLRSLVRGVCDFVAGRFGSGESGPPAPVAPAAAEVPPGLSQ